MIVSIVLYLAFLFRLTWRYKEVYRQWCRDNYSDDKDMDISWLRRYGIGVMLIGVAYFWLLFDGSTYCLIVHNLTVQCFFCYTLYKGLFHDNPYTEDFFRHTLDETDARNSSWNYAAERFIAYCRSVSSQSFATARSNCITRQGMLPASR